MLWSAALPASAQATPMTYRASRGGRQYIVIAAGGHAVMGSALGDYLIAFALP
jgi:glucose dehydrogenase